MSRCRRSNQRINSMRRLSKAKRSQSKCHAPPRYVCMCVHIYVCVSVTKSPKKLMHDGCLAP